jgi:hypothetical protein
MNISNTFYYTAILSALQPRWSLMMKIDTVRETLEICSILTRLVSPEYNIELIHHDSFKTLYYCCYYYYYYYYSTC